MGPTSKIAPLHALDKSSIYPLNNNINGEEGGEQLRQEKQEEDYVGEEKPATIDLEGQGIMVHDRASDRVSNEEEASEGETHVSVG